VVNIEPKGIALGFDLLKVKSSQPAEVTSKHELCSDAERTKDRERNFSTFTWKEPMAGRHLGRCNWFFGFQGVSFRTFLPNVNFFILLPAENYFL
jgi:hypothetical protein